MSRCVALRLIAVVTSATATYYSTVTTLCYWYYSSLLILLYWYYSPLLVLLSTWVSAHMNLLLVVIVIDWRISQSSTSASRLD